MKKVYPKKSGQEELIYPFADDGNYIAMHRVLFDEVMPKLGPNAWKLLCLIIRKTRGWNKESDQIDYKQIFEGIGVNNPGTVSDAIRELEGYRKASKKPVIWVRDESMMVLINVEEVVLPSGKIGTNRYSLNLSFCIKPSTEIVDGKKIKKPTTKNVDTITNNSLLSSSENSTKSNSKKYVGDRQPAKKSKIQKDMDNELRKEPLFIPICAAFDIDPETATYADKTEAARAAVALREKGFNESDIASVRSRFPEALSPAQLQFRVKMNSMHELPAFNGSGDYNDPLFGDDDDL